MILLNIFYFLNLLFLKKYNLKKGKSNMIYNGKIYG